MPAFLGTFDGSRRRLLVAASAGLLSLRVGGLGTLRAAGFDERPEFDPALSPRARSVIFVFLGGGLSQLDSFDMKPAAPAEVRGEFHPVATRTPGIAICEHLPRLAQISRLWALCRSFTHKEAAHGPACHSVLTGRTELPPGVPGGCTAPPTPRDWPSLASLVTYALPGRNDLPPAISIPARLNPSVLRPGTLAGRLGAKHDPWLIEPVVSPLFGCLPNGFDWELREGAWVVVPARPDDAGFYRAPEVTLREDVGSRRFAQRVKLLDFLEGARPARDPLAPEGNFDKYRGRAVSLLRGAETSGSLFDVPRAPAAEQDRYGRHEWGWNLLLARRLVEAGVPLVQVTLGRNGDWDTHRDNFRLLRDFLFPPFDQALSGLLLDLDERGLLEETLVVAAGEFGRSPRIVAHEEGRSVAGRDHWPAVQSILLAGGGVQGGRVLGASDAIAAAPADFPVTPEDLAATIYRALGVPRNTVWYEPQDAEARVNPQPLYHGEPIRGLV